MIHSIDRCNEVTVVFADAALRFPLPEGATLEDLAARIAALEERHAGEPVAIGVRLRH